MRTASLVGGGVIAVASTAAPELNIVRVCARARVCVCVCVCVCMLTYADISPRPPRAQLSLDAMRPARVISTVLSVSLGMPVHGLPDADRVCVVFNLDYTKQSDEAFASSYQRFGKPKCVFYDHDVPRWSQDGCSSVAITSSHVTCCCNHLTSLAVLMGGDDVSGEDSAMRVHWTMWAGLSISLVLLAVTSVRVVLHGRMATSYVGDEMPWYGLRRAVVLNQMAALAISEVLICCIQVPESSGPCTAVSILLLSAVLVYFALLNVEGYLNLSVAVVCAADRDKIDTDSGPAMPRSGKSSDNKTTAVPTAVCFSDESSSDTATTPESNCHSADCMATVARRFWWHVSLAWGIPVLLATCVGLWDTAGMTSLIRVRLDGEVVYTEIDYCWVDRDGDAKWVLLAPMIYSAAASLILVVAVYAVSGRCSPSNTADVIRAAKASVVVTCTATATMCLVVLMLFREASGLWSQVVLASGYVVLGVMYLWFQAPLLMSLHLIGSTPRRKSMLRIEQSLYAPHLARESVGGASSRPMQGSMVLDMHVDDGSHSHRKERSQSQPPARVSRLNRRSSSFLNAIQQHPVETSGGVDTDVAT